MAEELDAILKKYTDQEGIINEKLSERKEEKIQKRTEYKKARKISRIEDMERAVARNEQILQEMETAKGFLRSKAIFSPSEMVFDDISRQYNEAPALPVVTWQCHLPVFV